MIKHISVAIALVPSLATSSLDQTPLENFHKAMFEILENKTSKQASELLVSNGFSCSISSCFEVQVVPIKQQNGVKRARRTITTIALKSDVIRQMSDIKVDQNISVYTPTN